jgi:hypothetical protein
MPYKSLDLIEYFKSNEIKELSHTIKISSKENIDKPVVVFGLATHGNEPCGVVAAYQFLQEYKKFNLDLKCGTVYFSMINPDAFTSNIRLIDDNMNRVFGQSYPSYNSSEIVRSHEIKQFLETLNFDTFIDIHSMFPSDNQMILLSGTNYQDSLELAKEVTKIDDVLVEDIDNGHLHSFAKKILCSQNKTPHVFLVECGLHDLKKTSDKALEVILRTLKFYNMIDSQLDHLLTITNLNSNPQLIIIFRKHCMIENGINFEWLIPNIQNKHKIRKDDPVCKTDKGIFLSPVDGYIIMPGAIENIKPSDTDCGWITTKI